MQESLGGRAFMMHADAMPLPRPAGFASNIGEQAQVDLAKDELRRVGDLGVPLVIAACGFLRWALQHWTACLFRPGTAQPRAQRAR